MSTLSDGNIIVGLVLLVVFIYIIFSVFSPKEEDDTIVAKKKEPDAVSDTSSEKEHASSRSVVHDKESIPRLPRNETLYQILSNSRLTGNNIPFNLSYLLDEMTAFVHQNVHSETVELLFDLDENIPEKMLGSPKRLMRILINLIENSVINSEEGLVRLDVKLKSKDKKSSTLTFEIIDKGRGMNQNEISALFSNPMDREQNGHIPLGFYVANELIRSEKGALTVLSERGKGTRILFDLKFDIVELKEKPAVHLPSEACSTLRVAVIERYGACGNQFKNIIGPYVEALDTYIQEFDAINPDEYLEYDIVIADHHFLNESVVRTFKNNNTIVIMTQSLLEDNSKVNVPVDYLLSKPFTKEHLIEMLIMFYGVAETKESEKQPESLEQKIPDDTQSRFETFVSDAEIPVSKNVTKKNFNIFSGERVLVVEDNLINRRVIQGLLGDSGIELSFAENGLDALEVIEKVPPFDLVLMDINMPVLDGIETTRRIREKHEYDSMPIVAFTGLNLQDQIEKMREVGMNAHMAKPLNIGRVYSIFFHYLSKHKMYNRDV